MIWIKAAVEHRIVRLEYLEKPSQSTVSVHEVEPDHVGRRGGFLILRTGPPVLRAARDRSTGEGPCSFEPAFIISMELTDETFEPRPEGRWMEHLEEYHALDLRDEEF
jgi:hypothetical protein